MSEGSKLTRITGNDSSWTKISAHTYRNYHGASVVGGERLLTAIEYGGVYFRFGPIGRHPVVFAFCSVSDKAFPSFLKSTLIRHFYGKAICASCSVPMTKFQMRAAQELEGFSEEGNLYLTCKCGYSIWQMELTQFDVARGAIDRNAAPWRRKQKLVAAGGKHSRRELRQILELQEGCCIYCNANFTEEHPWTKDHLLPLTEGGSDWALNIVLACRGCNSSRGNIPFRTFCTLMSPSQNKRILAHLARRLAALEMEITPKEAFDCFERGLAKHDPKHPRYVRMKGTSTAGLNARANRLLPRNVTAILKMASMSGRNRKSNSRSL